MSGRCRRHSKSAKWLRWGPVCFVLAACIPLVWSVFAADSRVDVNEPVATKFQFARLRYPGGIPGYLKNWYTDYPAMETHLSQLLQRLTGIAVAPATLV